MKVLIDLDESLLKKIVVLSNIEGVSLQSFLEMAISTYLNNKLYERLNSLTDEEKEDIGLLLLMHQVDRKTHAEYKEIMKILE